MTDSRSFGVWGEGTRLAVLGDPVGHSRSPALHAAAYAALGLPWRYGRHRVERSGLSAFLAGRGPGWRGLSVTMPLKAEALRAADRADGLARLTGAVNTLVFDGPEPDAGISGWNTDVEGVRRALAGTDASSTDLLGAGSTAASIVAALAEEGCRRLRVVVREPARAATVLQLAERLGIPARALRLEDWTAQEDTSLVVNTIPAGERLLLRAPAQLRRRARLLEVVYDPWPSPLAAAWLQAGGVAISGLEMLLHQAAAQIELFADGVLPAVDRAAVERAMRAALDGRNPPGAEPRSP